jgi:peptide-methionine (S)-S-oxide reductase
MFMAVEQTITLGGGCFWCLEAVFERMVGVKQVESGYANGRFDRPTYEQVCTGETGHVEVVRVSFDAAHISLRDVLEVFFAIHDPTTLNRQGNDIGPQYRSGIYFEHAGDEAVAREVLGEAQRAMAAHGRDVVTELVPLQQYWPAEAYHQNYFARHPNQGYCAFVVGPKVEKFRKSFARWVKPE